MDLRDQSYRDQEAARPILLDHVIGAVEARRYLLAAILVGSVILALLVASFVPFTRRAEVALYPLSDFEVGLYQDADTDRFLKIDAPLLTTVFVDIVRDGTLLRKAMLNNKIVERQAGESDGAFELRLEQAMAFFTLRPPSPEAVRAGIRNWTMSYETKQRDAGYRFLSDLMNGANIGVRERLTMRFNRVEADYVRQRADRERDLRQKRGNLLADYDRSTTMRLAELDEQIALLKSTGNRQGQMLSQSDKFAPGQQISIVDANKLVFVPGYEQMERNAELIRQRQAKENFIPGLMEVDQELRGIEQDQLAIRARAAFNRTLGAANEFRAMNHDLTRASFGAPRMAAFAMLGIIGLGLMAALGLLFMTAYRLSRRGA